MADDKASLKIVRDAKLVTPAAKCRRARKGIASDAGHHSLGGQ